MSDTPPDRPARRKRRRATLRREIDTSIPSPCISVCQIDSATDECLGCRRTIDEIRDWIVMTAEEKNAVLTRIGRRPAALGDER